MKRYSLRNVGRASIERGKRLTLSQEAASNMSGSVGDQVTEEIASAGVCNARSAQAKTSEYSALLTDSEASYAREQSADRLAYLVTCCWRGSSQFKARDKVVEQQRPLYRAVFHTLKSFLRHCLLCPKCKPERNKAKTEH